MQIKLPIFLPDATRAVVKGIDSNDLISCGVKGVVVNTYHLQSSKIYDVKKFMNFNGLVVSDSGGWQIFSLIHRNKCKGKITDEGVVFYKNGAKQEIFTPEVSIQTQFEIGFDGYGAGGYLMQEGVFSEDIMQFMSNLIPNGKLKFALGVGAPTDVVKSFKCGWQIFDCTLPTRDARHK